jgi:6-pyruvoyl-tetrahydropterin synthase
LIEHQNELFLQITNLLVKKLGFRNLAAFRKSTSSLKLHTLTVVTVAKASRKVTPISPELPWNLPGIPLDSLVHDVTVVLFSDLQTYVRDKLKDMSFWNLLQDVREEYQTKHSFLTSPSVEPTPEDFKTRLKEALKKNSLNPKLQELEDEIQALRTANSTLENYRTELAKAFLEKDRTIKSSILEALMTMAAEDLV